MSKTEDCPSFLLEADFYTDPKFVDIEQEFGDAGAFTMLKLIGTCRKQSNFRVKRLELKALAFTFHKKLEELIAYIEAALLNGLMIEDDNGLGFSALDKRMQAFAEGREKKRNAGKAGAAALHKQRHDTAIADACDSLACTNTNTTTITNLNPKEGESKGETKPAPFPKPLDTPEIRKMIERWGQHLREKFNRSFDFMARDALLMAYGNRPKDLLDDIGWSLQNSWKTIQIRPKEQPKPSYSNGGGGGKSPIESQRPRSKDCREIFREQGIPVKPTKRSEPEETPEQIRDILARDIGGTL